MSWFLLFAATLILAQVYFISFLLGWNTHTCVCHTHSADQSRDPAMRREELAAEHKDRTVLRHRCGDCYTEGSHEHSEFHVLEWVSSHLELVDKNEQKGAEHTVKTMQTALIVLDCPALIQTQTLSNISKEQIVSTVCPCPLRQNLRGYEQKRGREYVQRWYGHKQDDYIFLI